MPNRSGADQGRRANGVREKINTKHLIPGLRIERLVLDDGTATAGQYDPAQAATNARKMVSDTDVVAAIGPMMSGAGKAMAPILSQGDLAIITPSLHQPGHHQSQVCRARSRPAGKAIYFRTVTTRRVPGTEPGQLFRGKAWGEVGVRAG